jgi:hypothetical protein
MGRPEVDKVFLGFENDIRVAGGKIVEDRQ